MSINRGADKEDIVCIHNGILLSHKKKEIMPLTATLLDLKIIIISKTQKNKYCMLDVSYVWNLTKWYKWTCLQNSSRCRKQFYGYWGQKKGREKLGDWDWHIHTAAATAAKSLQSCRLCATPEMAAHQASPSLGFSRQEHWSGLPSPSPMRESEKWKVKVKSE